MTLLVHATDDPPLSAARAPGIRVNAGHCIPAAALVDRGLADWARSRGVSVTARDDRDLDLVRYRRIRPIQVVFRCGPAAAPIRRAVAMDVSRFIVDTAQHMAQVAEEAHNTRYLYLTGQAPVMLGDRRLTVIGLHTEVEHAGDAAEWAAAARRLVHRATVLRACGAPVRRLALSGGSIQFWAYTPQAAGIVAAVDDAVRTACDERALARPAVTLAALTVAPALVRAR
ncbi:hypothetical protein C6A87_011655 [Mycobacterium sp. ITM-2016-00317]|uniref:hypothetical protein n=1 Tax=Mycobacterium sp. ITM-2016-00317 TaxID=2099694 RepID=UPI000D4E590F|nr:hypothetical protein [Mycobacterium sp. ITM-2016-00317]WNG89741.1 hypothetical protein C6A87_011655 [Mycobacterium sp. ITM-2016-00317]